MKHLIFKRENKNKKNFTQFSNIFQDDYELTSLEFRIFSMIWRSKNYNQLKQTEIAEKLNIDRRSVARCLSEKSNLIKNGYVYRIEYCKNKYNYYFCDEGRAKEYYLELVESGIINERGTIKKRQVEETSDLLQSIKNKAFTYIETKYLNPIDIIGIIDITEKHIEKNYNEAYIDDLSSMEYIDRQSIKKSAIVQLKEKNIEKFVNNLINKNR
jgi:predicted transcriptional regulator